LWTNVWVCR